MIVYEHPEFLVAFSALVDILMTLFDACLLME
uniref:Uncharacterized protein n=1 Tax=Arundo donax TaxID=35708 RepID=A0A0A8ZYJ8_ARUDO